MKKFTEGFVLLSIIFITLLFFNPYVLRGKPLFPGNLLVSFYSPWKYESFKGWEQGIPNKPIGFDNLRFFYPARKEIISQAKEGIIPLWNPYSFSGNILLADSQSAPLYPLNFIFFFLPFNHAWSILVMAVPIISGIFTYLLLRTFQLSKLSSFFGSMSFAFSGFMTVWMEENPAVSHSALWIPVAFYGIRKYVLSKGMKWWFLCLCALTFSVFAGFLQFAIYIWVASFFYSLYELKHLPSEEKRTLVISLILLFLCSFLISSIQLLPSFEAFLNSPRITASASYLLKEYLVPLTHLATFVTPDIFGNPGTYNFFGGGFYYDKILYLGLIPFLFALHTLFKRKKEVSFFIILGVVSLFLGMSSPVTKLIFGAKIPFFSAVTPSRIFFLTAFSLSILSSFGLENWKNNQDQKIAKRVFLIISLLFSISGLFIILRLTQMISSLPLQEIINKIALFLFPTIAFETRQATISLRNLVIPLGVFLLTVTLMIIWAKKQGWAKWTAVALLGLFIIHQYYFFRKSIYVTENEFVFPKISTINYLKENTDRFRVIGVGQARIFPNFLMSYQISSPEGLDPVFPRRYGELLNYINTNRFTSDIPRIEVRLIFEDEKDFKNETKLKTLSFLGVKYLVVPKKNEEKNPTEFLLPKNQFQKVWEKNELTIWENKLVMPRCWLVRNIIVAKMPEEIIKKMFSKNFDLRNDVVLEEKPPFLVQDTKISSNIEIIDYQSDKIKIRTETEAEKVLVCTDNYYPGWRVSIDGKESKLYRANYTFRSVIIPKGEHEILFSFQPSSFRYGIYMSLLGIASSGTYLVVKRMRKKT